MIRLKDEVGRWVHEILEHGDETYVISCSKYEKFAALFNENDPIVEELVDDGFEIVE